MVELSELNSYQEGPVLSFRFERVAGGVRRY